MKTRVTVAHVSMSVAAVVAVALLATNVLSVQISDCANSGGSTGDQCLPCLACVQDQNGDWQNAPINSGSSCTATVWNAAVTVDRVCGDWASMVYIVGEGPLMANAIPEPVLNATCVNGICLGTLGANGAAKLLIVETSYVCPAPLPPG